MEKLICRIVTMCIVLFVSCINVSSQTCTPVTLSCPADMTITADPGACGESVNYIIATEGDCPLISLNQTDGTALTSGDFFPIGVTQQVWMSEDSMGNTDVCSFSITIVEFPDPITDDACNANVNLSPDSDCQVLVTADMILEGGPYGCYDNYTVVLTTTAGLPVPNPITAEYIGQTIMASVQDPSGNSCWGYIHYEDYIITPLMCKTIDVNCRNQVYPSTDALDSIPFPVPDGFAITPSSGNGPFVVSDYDNCGDMTLSFVDNIIELDCTNGGPYTRTIYRTWTATDGQGNATSCVDTINLRVPSLSGTMIFPDRDGSEAPPIFCSGNWDANMDGIPQPEEIGDDLNMNCDVWGEYTDYTHQLNCGVIIDRSWSILNMCSGELVEFIQKIRLVDDAPPLIECSPELTGSTTHIGCFANYLVPQPMIEDGCSVVTYTVTSTAGMVMNIGSDDHPAYSINNLPIGWHTITFTAIDGCGNESSCTSDLHILDQIAPEARCENNLTIYLGAGQDMIDVDDLNVFSSDGCGIDYMKLRRVIQGSCDGTSMDDTQWHDVEEFCCDEAGQTILVELGVWDIYGNFSSCISHVFVESNVAPSMTCPPDISISCSYEFDYDNLGIFGSVVSDPSDVQNVVIDDIDWVVHCKGQNYTGPRIWGEDGLATSECDFTISEETTINTSCGKSLYENGVYLPAITRKFVISNGGGEINSCVQHIYILDCNPQSTDLTWPSDVLLDFCDTSSTSPDVTGEPGIGESSCDEVSTTYSDTEANVSGDTCRHIIRHWLVSSTCRNGMDTILGEYDQSIYIIKSDEIRLVNCPDTIRPSNTGNILDLVFNGDFELGDVGFTSEYNQVGGASNGYVVGSNPRDFNFDHAALDHTSGSGNMLIVDGSTAAGAKVWCQEIEVLAGTEYQVSAWVNNLITPIDNFSDPEVEFTIEPYGTVVLSSGPIPEVPDEWILLEGNWIAPQTRMVELCISSRSTASIGNDFGVDDISFLGAGQGCSINPDNSCEISVEIMPPSAFACDSILVDVSWEIDLDYNTSAGFEIDMSGVSDLPTYLPFGVHQIKWLAIDMCGGEISCETVVILEDCEPPLAICEDIGIQFIQDTNGVVIHAEDLAGMSIDNCGETSAQFLICENRSDETFLYGVAADTLIRISPETGEVYEKIGLENDGERSYFNLTFVESERKFYCLQNAAVFGSENPKLISFNIDGTMLEQIEIAPFEARIIHQVDALEYNPQDDKLYFSASLDADQGGKSESLMIVDRESGLPEFITTITSTLTDPDIDRMVIVDNQIVFFDYNVFDDDYFYSIDISSISGLITVPQFLFSLGDDKILSDFAVKDNKLFTQYERQLITIDLDDGSITELGEIHSENEFSMGVVGGFSFASSLNNFNCHLIDSVETSCEELLNNPDTFSYSIVVTDAAGNSDTCHGEYIVADSSMTCEEPRCELIYAINSNGDYYSINTATGEFNLVATTGVVTGTNAVAINDDLGIGYFGSDQTVYWIDLVDGMVGTVGTISVPGSLTAAAASYKNGHLYLGPEAGNQVEDIFRIKVNGDGKSFDSSPENLTNGAFPVGNFGDFVVMEGGLGEERMIMSVYNNVDGNRILEYLVSTNSFTELSFVPSSSSSQITIDNVGNIWYFNNANSVLGIIDVNTGVVTDANVVPVLISDMGRSWCPPATSKSPSIYFPELVMYTDVLGNTPNPFHDETSIDFYLEQDEAVVLNVYSINGILIERKEISGKTGLNSWIFNKKLESGTYLYQIQGSSINLTRRMVKID